MGMLTCRRLTLNFNSATVRVFGTAKVRGSIVGENLTLGRSITFEDGGRECLMLGGGPTKSVILWQLFILKEDTVLMDESDYPGIEHSPCVHTE